LLRLFNRLIFGAVLKLYGMITARVSTVKSGRDYGEGRNKTTVRLR